MISGLSKSVGGPERPSKIHKSKQSKKAKKKPKLGAAKSFKAVDGMKASQELKNGGPAGAGVKSLVDGLLANFK